MNLIGARIYGHDDRPPAWREYIVAGNGLFAFAQSEQMRALVPVAPAAIHGVAEVEPYAELFLPRVPAAWLEAVLADARRRLPAEAMYQFYRRGDAWHCRRPVQLASSASVDFLEAGDAVIDLHSHGALPAFFSSTDDGDEQGLRFYCVIGGVGTAEPEILCRAGVYGHHLPIDPAILFDGLGPFRRKRQCRECGCTDEDACPAADGGRCHWVEEDLCSSCVGEETRI